MTPFLLVKCCPFPSSHEIKAIADAIIIIHSPLAWPSATVHTSHVLNHVLLFELKGLRTTKCALQAEGTALPRPTAGTGPVSVENREGSGAWRKLGQSSALGFDGGGLS